MDPNIAIALTNRRVDERTRQLELELEQALRHERRTRRRRRRRRLVLALGRVARRRVVAGPSWRPVSEPT